jgi:hypothetical protein
MKTQTSACSDHAKINTEAVFTKIKSKVEKLQSLKADKNNPNQLLNGFLAFNESFKSKKCSKKSNENFDTELSEFNENNFLFGSEDLGFGAKIDIYQNEFWA